MSKTKAIHVRNRMIWALDNSHDVVLARMVEAAVEGGCPTWLAPQVEHWRVWAIISDLAFAIPLEWGNSEWNFCEQLVREARIQAVQHGDILPGDLGAWTSLPGESSAADFFATPAEVNRVIGWTKPGEPVIGPRLVVVLAYRSRSCVVAIPSSGGATRARRSATP